MLKRVYDNPQDAAAVYADGYPTIFVFTMFFVVDRKLVRITKNCSDDAAKSETLHSVGSKGEASTRNRETTRSHSIREIRIFVLFVPFVMKLRAQ